MKRILVGLAAGALLALAACGDDSGGGSAVTLTLVTHDSFVVTDAVLQSFTTLTGIKVQIAKGADAGTMVNRAVLTAGKPEGDVMWGVDNTLLSRAVDAKVFDAYQASALPADVHALDPTGTVTPVDTGDVCINYDKGWFATHHAAPPASLADLTKPEYKDLLVVENPATSSPGLAFLLATIADRGQPGWEDYWKALRTNGVKVVDSWTQAYSTDFSGSTGKGPRPLVVSYATSPPAEIVFATEPKPTEPPTASLTAGCFGQVEYAGVLRGTKHPKQARQLVDFLVSAEFQADMPLNMFVNPVRPGVPLPDEFKFAAEVDQPLSVPPADIEANREHWVETWTQIVLQ